MVKTRSVVRAIQARSMKRRTRKTVQVTRAARGSMPSMVVY